MAKLQRFNRQRIESEVRTSTAVIDHVITYASSDSNYNVSQFIMFLLKFPMNCSSCFCTVDQQMISNSSLAPGARTNT